jgi:hypothetical protein
LDWGVTPLGQQDALLKEISQSVPTTIMNAFTLGENTCHIQIKGPNIVVWTELNKLAVSTVYTPVATTGEFYPLFKKTPERNTLETNRTETWLPNQFKFRLFFIQAFALAGGVYNGGDGASFLVGKKEETTKVIRPPLPNIYTDGRVCMGGLVVKEQLLSVAFGKALTHLYNSRWNNDLSDGMQLDDTVRLFTFKDGVNKPPPARFDIAKVAHCMPINNLIYSDLPL